ncbi:MAG: twin-arginine translocation signal domain-containing protein, partial [Betaproteobacteria bacterium]|nr:twin-arginine translocation signal domain-containing protein [Betaproteobacteria bacterium]
MSTPPRTGRRGFLRKMAVGAGALAATSLRADESVPPWMQRQGRPIVDPPYGQPSPYEFDVVRIPFSTRLLNT